MDNRVFSSAIEQDPEYWRGYYNAMGEVAASIDCDIDMYKGELWADKIIALKSEIAEWNKLRSWFMDYPVDEEDEKLNREIAQAPVSVIVQAITEGYQEMKEKFLDASSELDAIKVSEVVGETANKEASKS